MKLLKRIACFFAGHKWQKHEVYLTNQHIFACSRCNRVIHQQIVWTVDAIMDPKIHNGVNFFSDTGFHTKKEAQEYADQLQKKSPESKLFVHGIKISPK